MNTILIAESVVKGDFMSKLKKTLAITTLLVILLNLVTNVVYAVDAESLFKQVEYSEDYKKWLELSDEEKEKVMQPRMYDVITSNTESNNLIYRARLVGANASSRFSLKDVIPTNLTIRNQKDTQSCWAFAALSSLETNIALDNKTKNTNTSKVYDYSERHMEYATSKNFANGVQNKAGYNREVDSGGQWYIAESYLTNGQGAIDESQMPFENNHNLINISEIQNKTVTSQVYDTVDFANYANETGAKKTEIMNQIKQHIKNHGSVYACIHGNSSSVTAFNCYNNETGAKCCKNALLHAPDHAISIIGWDDNYSVDNFAEEAKPTSNGAWIVRNSWGERAEEDLAQLKDEIFTTYRQQCIARGWNSGAEIPNEFLEQAGYTIENGKAYVKIGDNGIIYVSYEDCNIAKTMFGIEKAADTVDYDKIYQYDEYYPSYDITFNGSKIMLCNVFDRESTDKEYLTQVALYAPETYTCKVYVNPNGDSKSKDNMQLVQLKAGESETINAGYHTLEFDKPIEIKGNKFAVAISIEGSRSYGINFKLEAKADGAEVFNSVKVENNKCFVANTNNFEQCQWYDLGHLSQAVSSLPNGDSTIKAFTVTGNIKDGSLRNIEIVTPPKKTQYLEGENFDKTGMVVKANYNRTTNPSVILDEGSYNITGGSSLKAGQTSVTITYEGKSVSQPIKVEKNSVVSLSIKNPPKKIEYYEGQKFDSTGMVIEATYKDGSKKNVTDYKIVDGNNLKANQKYITVSYDDKTVKQAITVVPNPLVELKITKAPNKTKYVAGQSFDKTGMVITGVYENGDKHEIIDYTIENGTKLSKNQTSVTIKYEDKTVKQPITVVEKAVKGIAINKKISKTEYIQNKEKLDLTGGTITVSYNDGSKEEVSIESELVEVSGFNNKELGKNTITVQYGTYKTTFDVEIVAEAVPVNSNLDNVNCKISNTKYYTYTDASKQEYLVMNAKVDNISRNNENDSYEYYYYLSSNKDEKNIKKWVKIKDANISNDGMEFKINTKDLVNYSELSDSNNLYLYIKEVAIKGGNQSVKISKSMKLNSDVEIETYLDDVKVDSTKKDNNKKSSNKDEDKTKAPGILPNTGVGTIAIALFIVAGVGIVFYIRYKNLKRYIK